MVYRDNRVPVALAGFALLFLTVPAFSQVASGGTTVQSTSQARCLKEHGAPDQFLIMFSPMQGKATTGTAPASRRIESWFYQREGLRVMFDQVYRVRETKLPSDCLAGLPKSDINPCAFTPTTTAQAVTALLGKPNTTESASTVRHEFKVYRYLKPGEAPKSFTFLDGKLVAIASGLCIAPAAFTLPAPTQVAEASVRLGTFNAAQVRKQLPDWTAADKAASEAGNQFHKRETQANQEIARMQISKRSAATIEQKAVAFRDQINAQHKTSMTLVSSQRAVAQEKIADAASKIARDKSLDVVADINGVWFENPEARIRCVDVEQDLRYILGITTWSPQASVKPPLPLPAPIGFLDLARARSVHPASVAARQVHLDSHRAINLMAANGNRRIQAARSAGAPPDFIKKLTQDLQGQINQEAQQSETRIRVAENTADASIVMAIQKVAKAKGIACVVDKSSIFSGRRRVQACGVDLTQSIIDALRGLTGV